MTHIVNPEQAAKNITHTNDNDSYQEASKIVPEDDLPDDLKIKTLEQKSKQGASVVPRANTGNESQEDLEALYAKAKPVYTTKQTWSGAGKYEDKVIQYIKLVNSNFSVSAKDEQFVNKQYWPKKAKATLMPIGITVLSICGFLIFCWIIGWVVRGFTGIAMGQDRKN